MSEKVPPEFEWIQNLYPKYALFGNYIVAVPGNIPQFINGDWRVYIEKGKKYKWVLASELKQLSERVVKEAIL